VFSQLKNSQSNPTDFCKSAKNQMLQVNRMLIVRIQENSSIMCIGIRHHGRYRVCGKVVIHSYQQHYPQLISS